MGLFGKNFDFDRMQAGLTAAQATLAGDYGGAAQAWGAYAKAKKTRQQEASDQAERQRLHATIDADDTLSPQAKAYAKAYPSAYMEHYFRRLPAGLGAGAGAASDEGPAASPPGLAADPEALAARPVTDAYSDGAEAASMLQPDRFGSNSGTFGSGCSVPQVLSDRDILLHDANGGSGFSQPRRMFGRRPVRFR